MQKTQSVTNVVLAIWTTLSLSTVVANIDEQTGAMSSVQLMGTPSPCRLNLDAP
jgi:hypothetical protein